MKIKCPDCKKELENSDPNTLVNEYAAHCCYEHPMISCGRFARQEFKIHEKIEVGLEYRDGQIDKQERRCADEKLTILYSLLDNSQNT